MGRHLLALAVSIGLFAGQPSAAFAGAFSVDPVTAKIEEGRSSTVVTVTNRSHETTRFQVTNFAWQQSGAGEMLLQPSDDVLAFPTLFVLGPGEQRRVRVAATGAPSETERAYRLFVQELPPLDTLGGRNGGLGLSIRTKIGIPVFVAKASARPSVRIAEGAVRSGAFVLDVVNDGAAHTIVHTVRAQFLDAGGRPLDTQEAGGWYVLAHENREFRFPVKPAPFVRAQRVRVDVNVDGTTMSKTIELAGRQA